jgi:hypothetical protein
VRPLRCRFDQFGLKAPEPTGFSDAFDAFIAVLKIDRAGKPITKADVDLDARKLTIPKSKSNAGRRR